MKQSNVRVVFGRYQLKDLFVVATSIALIAVAAAATVILFSSPKSWSCT